MNRPTRRRFLRATAATGLGALYAGLPADWNGTLYAADAPEHPDMRFGFVAVESGAPIVIAHEKGLFKKYGINSSISKENGWAAARDKLISGENQATHLKYGQSIASNLGALGAPKIHMAAPWTLNRNGSGFLVSLRSKDKPTKDPQSWRPFVDNAKKAGEPATVAVPIPVGVHHMLFRYVWANAGINADKDLKVITLPPAQMIQNMKVGAMSACAMVEPWPTRGVMEKVSYVAFYGWEIWPDHPAKALTFLEKFTDQNPKGTVATLRAIHEAAIYCDDPKNHQEIAKILSTPTYLNSPVESILPTLQGHFDHGDGRVADEPRYALRYSKNNTNYTQPKEMTWFATQFRRWGMIEGTPDYKGVVANVCRNDIYREAMKGVSFTNFKQDDSPITFFDGKVFNPAEPEKYATSFPVNSLKS